MRRLSVWRAIFQPRTGRHDLAIKSDDSAFAEGSPLDDPQSFCRASPRSAYWLGAGVCRIALVDRDNPHKEVRFAGDSPLEGDGFEPSVPRLGVSSVVAPTAPTGLKGSAAARRDRCEIAPASSPTSGLVADLVHTNSAQDRLLFSSICCSRRAIPWSEGP